MIGRYLDALSDEQRDLVIEAEDFFDGPSYVSIDGCGCLVAVAEMESRIGGSRPIDDSMFVVSEYRRDKPGWRFPRLCTRFGKDRIVALCKARAAKGNRLHEIRSEVYKRISDDGLVPLGGMSGRYPEDCR